MDFAYIICVFLSTLLLHQCLGQDTGAAAEASFSLKITPDRDDQKELKENFVITCTSTSTGDKPLLHWEINDVRVTTPTANNRVGYETISDSEVRLRIQDTQNGDEGTYKCVGTIGSEIISKTVRIEVYESIKIHSKNNQYGIVGESGIVICNATGKPTPNVDWKFKNGTKIHNSDKYTVNGIQLVIMNLTFEDDRTYVCDATVIQNGKNELMDFEFKVVTRPVIEDTPIIRPINPKVGDVVTIICQASSVPDPEYSFKTEGADISGDQVNMKDGILTITNLTEDKEGTYTCVATNRAGYAEKEVFLDVKIPPSIVDLPEVIEVAEGEQKQVTCQAKGDPTPKVTWEKDGVAYEVRNEDDEQISVRKQDLANLILNFPAIKPQDAGIYICSAISDVGSIMEEIKLDVTYKPHFKTDYEVKEFYSWEDHTANLTCQASANKVAYIQWFKLTDSGDAELLDTNTEFYRLLPVQEWPEYHLSSRSLLVTGGADDSVFGKYECEANNSLGSTRHVVELKRAVPPEKPLAYVESTLSTMVTLRVNPSEITGGQPVLQFKIRYYSGNDSSNTVEKVFDITPSSTYELRNLAVKTVYTANVSAQNAVGLGEATTITFETKEVSRPLQLNMTSPRYGSEHTSYKVTWSEPDNGGLPITQFVVKYKEITVNNEDAEKWVEGMDIGKSFEEKTINDPSARSFTIENLKPNTFYNIRISAFNREGESTQEIKIIKTSEEGSSQTGQVAFGEEDEDEKGNTVFNDDNNDNVVKEDDGNKEIDDKKAGEAVGDKSGSDSAGSAGLGSGPIIGIVIGLLILIVIIAVIVSLVFKKKPELVGRLRGLGGKGGEEERGKSEDGKDPAEEEKLIKKDDTVKVENETEEGKPEQAVEEQQEEFEPDSKPELQSSPDTGAKNGTVDKPPELSTPAPTTEIKITPETPEKPESPTA